MIETNINRLCREVRELDEKATPGPWENRCHEFSNHERARNIWSEYGWIARFTSPSDSDAHDAALTAHYRTSAVRLAKICERYEEALDKCYQYHGSDFAANALADGEKLAGGE